MTGPLFESAIKKLEELVKRNELDGLSFFESDYGKAALEAYADELPEVTWPQDPSIWREKLAEARKSLFIDEVPLKSEAALPLLAAANQTCRLGLVFETAFIMADPDLLRMKPYEDEPVFRFLSAAQFRFQFLYRAITHVFDTSIERYAMCRALPTDITTPSDPETERIRSWTMTELFATGNNAFVISDTLRSMFLHTDVAKIFIEDIELPYGAFQIMTGDRTVFFTRIEVGKGRRVWVFDNVDFGCVQLKEEPGTETLGDLWARLPEGFWDNAPDAAEACEEAFHLVCNLSLYLATRKPEVRRAGRKTTRGKGRKKARRKAEVAYTPISWVLYPSAKVKRTNVSTDGSGVRAHWVRGHWRKQPYGPRDDPSYERIWIEPHLRGSESGDGSSDEPRKYKV